MQIPKKEIQNRISKFFELMNDKCPDWDIALVFDRVNQYYFTGTMQNSVLVFTKQGDAHYFVRKSYKRAKIESPFENIHPMNSFRDILNVIGDKGYNNGYVEMSKVPMGLYNMANKHLKIENVKPLDNVIAYQHSLKSEYEIDIMREVGKRHREFLLNTVPGLMEEGMTELDFAAKCNYELVKRGHYGTARFNMFGINPATGQMGFGENSIYPTSFDGPGGVKGLHPSQPSFGDKTRSLKKGDIVFLDFPFAMYGYHTDTTQIYIFGDKANDELKHAHNECIKIEKAAADMLKVGANPADIYNHALNILDDKYIDNFMGVKGENVKFLGHGVGLYIDESPVISPKFTEMLEKNMTIAIEPKISIEGVGIVGVEDTYIVGDNKGECITGGGVDIIEV